MPPMGKNILLHVDANIAILRLINVLVEADGKGMVLYSAVSNPHD